jgi:hypothetical protein
MIPEKEWDEFLALKTLMDTEREKFEYSAERVVQLVKFYGITSLDEKVVKKLVYAVNILSSPDPETFGYCLNLALYFLWSALIELAVQ